MLDSRSAEGRTPFGSFRDPDGRVLAIGTDVLRLVTEATATTLREFLAAPCGRDLQRNNSISPTEFLPAEEARVLLNHPHLRRASESITEGAVLRHARVDFVSYPYEWPPEMLHAAGKLTLHLARKILDDGFGLKDATPFNVLFAGSRPVFVDLSSIQRRDAGDAIWLAAAQFERTFILPLLANRCFGLQPQQIFTTRRDGMLPEELYRMASPLRRLHPALLLSSTLPTWLDRIWSSPPPLVAHRQSSGDLRRAQFTLSATLGRLERLLDYGLRPPARSAWTEYGRSHGNHYSSREWGARIDAVREVLATVRPRRVVDVGCNTGYFSRIAAQSGASVLAIDRDPDVVGAVWRLAVAEDLAILPLVVDIARPSPPIGWRESECASFLDRLHGTADLMLMMAVMHHLMVTERIPLPEIVDFAAESCTTAVVEYVGPEDPQFGGLARTHGDLYSWLTPQTFEQTWAARFRIAKAVDQLDGSRRIYVFERLK